MGAQRKPRRLLAILLIFLEHAAIEPVLAVMQQIVKAARKSTEDLLTAIAAQEPSVSAIAARA